MLQNIKKLKRDLLETLKNFRKNAEQSDSVENVKKRTLWSFLTSNLLQNIKKLKGTFSPVRFFMLRLKSLKKKGTLCINIDEFPRYSLS